MGAAPDRPAPSWWLQQALAAETPAPRLEGQVDADVCIVGGGYTGLWTALRIAELDPGARIVLVEADVCGAGASGRNGGFALTFWHHFLGLEGICGTGEARRLSEASEAAVDEIDRFCAAHGIDASLRRDGWLWVATSPAQRGAWDRTLAAVERAGARPFERLGREEVVARTGSAAHLDGVFEAGAATLQPATLVRGLRRVARERGVAVHERSPMVALERGRRLAVRTPAGRVRAERVVIAANAWSLRLRELRRAFAAVGSDIVLTERVPDRLEAMGWRGGAGISDSRLMVHYYRTTPDGRVAFGKGGSAVAFGARVEVPITARRKRLVAAQAARVYPSLAGARIEAAWTGPVDRPMDGLPFFTRLGRPDLLCGAGFSGNGVGPTVVGGRILASLALDRDDEWSACGLVRPAPGGMPPEPFRFLGGHLVRRAVARREQAQDSGREPGRLTERIASLAPTGLVPLD